MSPLGLRLVALPVPLHVGVVTELFVNPVLPVLVPIFAALHLEMLDHDDSGCDDSIVGMSATTTSQLLMAWDRASSAPSRSRLRPLAERGSGANFRGRRARHLTEPGQTAHFSCAGEEVCGQAVAAPLERERNATRARLRYAHAPLAGGRRLSLGAMRKEVKHV